MGAHLAVIIFIVMVVALWLLALPYMVVFVAHMARATGG